VAARQHRAPPVVTISGGADVGDRAEVLEGAPEPRTRRLAPRWLVPAALALAAGLVAVAGVVVVADERRLGGALALRLVAATGVEGRTVWELTGRTALVSYRADVRNDGPRAVTVTRAELGGFRSSREDRRLEPGARVTVTLSRVVRCADPQAVLVPGAVSVDVTTAAGRRSAQLPVEPGLRPELDRAADRACGVLPLVEALEVTATSVQRVGGAVVVGLEAANRSTRPLRLARVVVQQGLRGAVRAPDGALDLPLPLPPATLGEPPVRVPLLLEVTVVRCAAIAQLTPAPPGAVPLDTISFGVDDGGGLLVGPVLLDLNDRALRILVEEAC
jgi:hypothetical protein